MAGDFNQHKTMNAIKHINSLTEKLTPEALERLTLAAICAGQSTVESEEDLADWITPKIGQVVVRISDGKEFSVTGFAINYASGAEYAVCLDEGQLLSLTQIKPKK